jgi:cation diffusion facilitator family transporter
MVNLSHIREKKRVALTSVIAALCITAGKLVVGLATNSLGILSEAAHSGLDLVAAIITLVAVSIADKPADREHHYGHGKIENISAFVETLLLFVTCAWIIWEAVGRLLAESVEVEANFWGFAVITVSIIVDYSRSRALSRVAKKHNSQALEADALHFASDIWSSLVVLLGLACVRFGYIWVDAVAALAVAILVLVVSYRLARRTIDALMDRVPKGLEATVSKAVREVPGVEDIRSIRLRSSGARTFADITVSIARTISFQQAHAVMDRIEAAVHAVAGMADVVVHGEPHESAHETVADKVRMIVVNLGLVEPHNLRVYRIDQKYHIDFHLECDKTMTFEQAHQLTSEVEAEIRNKVPATARVTIHLEEFDDEATETGGTLVQDSRLEQDITQFVRNDAEVMTCTEITMLKEGDKLNLAFTCTFDRRKTLGDIHRAVSMLEDRLRQKFADLGRVTIHTEPT